MNMELITSRSSDKIQVLLTIIRDSGLINNSYTYNYNVILMYTSIFDNQFLPGELDYIYELYKPRVTGSDNINHVIEIVYNRAIELIYNHFKSNQ